MLIRFTAFVLVLLLFWSCEEVVDLDVDFEPGLVVVSEIAPDRPVELALSRSRPILSQDPTEYVVADQVSILNRGTGQVTDLFLQEPIKDTLNPDFEIYPFYFSGEEVIDAAANTYDLNIRVDGEEPVTASTTIPDPVRIQSLSLRDFSESEDPREDDTYEIKFDLSFSHNERIAENYHLVFYFEYILEVIEETDTNYFVISQVPTVQSLTMSTPYTSDFENGVLIKGEDLSSGLNSLEAVLSVNFNKDFSPFPPQLVVELRNTNVDYHNYHFSLTRQRSQRDSILSQAILVPSNINNGLGVFSGYNYDLEIVRLNE